MKLSFFFKCVWEKSGQQHLLIPQFTQNQVHAGYLLNGLKVQTLKHKLNWTPELLIVYKSTLGGKKKPNVLNVAHLWRLVCSIDRPWGKQKKAMGKCSYSHISIRCVLKVTHVKIICGDMVEKQIQVTIPCHNMRDRKSSSMTNISGWWWPVLTCFTTPFPRTKILENRFNYDLMSVCVCDQNSGMLSQDNICLYWRDSIHFHRMGAI